MNDGDRSSLESPYPPLGHFLPEVEGLETERYDGRYRRAFARRQPSPSGRGQGEGSDVNPTSAVIGAGARKATLPSVNQTGKTNVRVDSHVASILAPTRQSQFCLAAALIWCGPGVLPPAPMMA